MKLQRLGDVRISSADVVFRESPMHLAAPTAVFLAVTIGLGIAAVVSQGVARWGLCVMGAFMFLCLWLFFGGFKKSLGPANWLVRVTPGGDVTVKFRSFANAHFPAEDIVAFTLKPPEIQWVRQSRDRVVTRGGDAGDRLDVRHRYLDLGVDEAVAKEIDEQIQIERRREGPETGRIIKNRSWTLDYPVSVVEGHVIRIEWRGKSAWVTPKLESAVELIAKHTKVEPEAAEGVKDYTSATRDDAEDKILALAESGDEVGAVALARQVYKCTLTEAKQLVDGLMGKKQSAAAGADQRGNARRS